MLSYFIICCHTSLYIVLFHYMLSYFYVYCLTSSYVIILHHILSYFIISFLTSLYVVILHYTFSYFIICCLTSMCIVLLHHILSYFIVSFLTSLYVVIFAAVLFEDAVILGIGTESMPHVFSPSSSNKPSHLFSYYNLERTVSSPFSFLLISSSLSLSINYSSMWSLSLL